jgi:phosphatidylinositol alpha-1,6-mannosyltransferase
MPARAGRFAYSVGALRSALVQSVDFVFCGHVFMAPLAALIARLKAAKLIIQTHGIEAWPRPTRLQREAVESADLLLCVSRYTRAAVLSWAAIEPERVLVLPNTFKEMFTPTNGVKPRKHLGTGNKRTLLTVARMDPSQQYKGQDRVISAIPYVLSQGYDVEYLVVGEGEDRGRLESLAREVGVSDRVHFLGPVDLQVLGDLYCKADLFVMPSTGEGFGIAFLEAMVSGTPTLGLRVGGAMDALADGELGTIVSEPDLPAAIVRTLAKPRPDPVALAAATHARFGRPQFADGVRAVLSRLMEAS